jgi:hypothetical protein
MVSGIRRRAPRDLRAAARINRWEVRMLGLMAVLAQAGGGSTSGARVSYTPDWSLFSSGQHLVQQGLNLLAALGLACCAGFFIWGAILAAGGVSSQIPHNVARGKHQMFVSALCALGVGIGALVVNTFFSAGTGA